MVCLSRICQGDINIVTLENSNYIFISHLLPGPSWSWSYGTCSWIYNYLCNQCLSPLMWVRISIRAKCATLYDKDCQWLATGEWFSPGPPVSFTNKIERHNIAEILLKVALNTIKQTNKQTSLIGYYFEFYYTACFLSFFSQFNETCVTGTYPPTDKR